MLNDVGRRGGKGEPGSGEMRAARAAGVGNYSMEQLNHGWGCSKHRNFLFFSPIFFFFLKKNLLFFLSFPTATSSSPESLGMALSWGGRGGRKQNYCGPKQLPGNCGAEGRKREGRKRAGGREGEREKPLKITGAHCPCGAYSNLKVTPRVPLSPATTSAPPGHRGARARAAAARREGERLLRRFFPLIFF